MLSAQLWSVGFIVSGVSFPTVYASPVLTNGLSTAQSAVPIPWSPGMTRVPSTTGNWEGELIVPRRRRPPNPPNPDTPNPPPNIFEKALSALWVYHCPIGGSGQKTFQWKAKADVAHNSVTATNILNIDAWQDLKIVDKSFHAFFIHGFCFQRGRLACIYKFQGKTTGWVDIYGLHMGLILHSTDGNENPKVEEECIDTGGPEVGTHWTCPAIVEQSSARCPISYANADYIPVPPEHPQ